MIAKNIFWLNHIYGLSRLRWLILNISIIRQTKDWDHDQGLFHTLQEDARALIPCIIIKMIGIIIEIRKDNRTTIRGIKFAEIFD
jgi:hypothetical protein